MRDPAFNEGPNLSTALHPKQSQIVEAIFSNDAFHALEILYIVPIKILAMSYVSY
jgi:hypothetical protein